MSNNSTDDLVELSETPLDMEAAIRHVSMEQSGGINVFLGTTRAERSPDGKRLRALDYQCYESMAIKKMQWLCLEARRRWVLNRVAIFHRVGEVPIMQPSVVIAVSSAHRAGAFDASRFIIDTLKTSVPIWKREVWEDGSVTWVEGTTPRTHE